MRIGGVTEATEPRVNPVGYSRRRISTSTPSASGSADSTANSSGVAQSGQTGSNLRGAPSSDIAPTVVFPLAGRVGALERHGISSGVLVDEVDPPEIHGRLAPRIDKIIERAEAGEELTGGELELLLQSDRVEKDRLFEAVSEAVTVENQSE